MLIKKRGNLLDLAENGEFDLIVHGVNCFNTMGGGIAREIRERYPNIAEVDAATIRGDYNKLGNWTTGNAGPSGGRFRVINAYTQYNMSTGDDVFEYAAFELILQKLAFGYPDAAFGFPKIGMGLAHGDEQRIMKMLEDFAEKMTALGGTVTLVEFK